MTTFAAIMDLGVINKLKIARHTDYGYFLEDEEQEEVLLPNAYVTNDMKVGDDIDVFIYKDSEDRIVATTETPKIKLDQFAFLKVVGVSQYGVFMDWGLPKDLMVPYAEQTKDMEEGSTHLVFLTIDDQTDRLIGSAKVNDFLFFEDIKLEENQEVELVLYELTDLGIMCIVDNLYRGMIFHSDIHKEIRVGDTVKGYVKQIREDGKVDVSLTPIGYKASVDPHSQMILDKLKENNGFLAMNDKSDPEIINQEFGISKKAFKRAIGNLYKQKLILLENDGVILV